MQIQTDNRKLVRPTMHHRRLRNVYNRRSITFYPRSITIKSKYQCGGDLNYGSFSHRKMHQQARVAFQYKSLMNRDQRKNITISRDLRTTPARCQRANSVWALALPKLRIDTDLDRSGTWLTRFIAIEINAQTPPGTRRWRGMFRIGLCSLPNNMAPRRYGYDFPANRVGGRKILLDLRDYGLLGLRP